MEFVKEITVGNLVMEWGKRTYVMGIINVTPDSFSGDGLVEAAPDTYVEMAYQQAVRFIENGADILDIGGESTRPGASIISAQEELDRVVPVIERIAELGGADFNR